MLTGLRIAVPRTTERAGALVDALRALNAQVYDLPLVRLEQLDHSVLVTAAQRLDRYAWVLLLAPNSVERLADAVAIVHGERLMPARRLAVAGTPALNAIVAQGWAATVQTTRPPFESLLDTLAARSDVEGAQVLYPAITGGRDAFPDGLRALGAAVDVVPVYRQAPDVEGTRAFRALLNGGDVDLVAVSTPHIVDALLDAVPAEQSRRARLACIGPQTARAARTAGFPVEVEAVTPTVEGLVSAIVASVMKRR